LDEGLDIPVDMAMIVVGRHPLCDVRLESLMISSRHCCMSPISGELRVEDMGSTNGIRINGYRVIGGRLRPGDELSIADFRYRLMDDQGEETTIHDPDRVDPAGGDPTGARLPAVAPICLPG
jgi:pSer/pThr/pTyr-binding forkhead associated (FHA) protein